MRTVFEFGLTDKRRNAGVCPYCGSDHVMPPEGFDRMVQYMIIKSKTMTITWMCMDCDKEWVERYLKVRSEHAT